MLKILDEKTLKNDYEIEQQYKDCKYLYIMMLGSKGILPPMIPRIAPHFMLPQS